MYGSFPHSPVGNPAFCLIEISRNVKNVSYSLMVVATTLAKRITSLILILIKHGLICDCIS